MTTFGGNEVQRIADHFKEQLSEVECNKIPQEWAALKTCVVHFRGPPLLQAYGDLPSPISEHSCVGGLDARTESKYSRVLTPILIHEEDKNILA